MRISVFGLGYVGTVSLACLARDGHEIVGVDIDAGKLDLLRSGRSPIVEEGIQELIREVVASGRVRVTSDVGLAIRETDLSFICVGTPSRPNGSQDLDAIERVARGIGAGLADKHGFHTIVIRSTIQPGTLDGMVRPLLEQASGKVSDRDFGLGFQPEFLREGTSITDYDAPPFTVVGSRSTQVADVLRAVFGHLPCELIVTNVGVAEMLKYACNAFHALKVTFANEIGRVSESAGIDARAVMELVCRDQRLNISRAYLAPGFAFGGSCLPKDLRALNVLSKGRDVTTPMLGSILASNRAHIDHLLDKVMQPGVRRVGMIGLSFKAGTDDLRESPLVAVAERLIDTGYDLRIYDPAVDLARLIGANKRFIDERIPHIGSLLVDSAATAVAHGQVVLVAVGGPEVIQALESAAGGERLVVDVLGLPSERIRNGRYVGVCW